MTQPANPLDNQAAIAQMSQELRDTIGLLITEFVRPNAAQLAANAEAIDRTSAHLDRVETIARFADEASSENEQRFENLLAEARADRAEWRETIEKEHAKTEADRAEWRETIEKERAKTEADRAEWREAIAEDRAKAEADRQKWQASFDAAMAEIRAIGEQNRALLSALATTNGRVDSLEQKAS